MENLQVQDEERKLGHQYSRGVEHIQDDESLAKVS